MVRVGACAPLLLNMDPGERAPKDYRLVDEKTAAAAAGDCGFCAHLISLLEKKDRECVNLRAALAARPESNAQLVNSHEALEVQKAKMGMCMEPEAASAVAAAELPIDAEAFSVPDDVLNDLILSERNTSSLDNPRNLPKIAETPLRPSRPRNECREYETTTIAVSTASSAII